MEERVSHIKSESDKDQEGAANGWMSSTMSEAEMEELSVNFVEDGSFSVKIEVPDAALIIDTDEESTGRHHAGVETDDGPVPPGVDASALSVKVEVVRGSSYILKEDMQEGRGHHRDEEMTEELILTGGGDGLSEYLCERRFYQELAEEKMKNAGKDLRPSASNNGEEMVINSLIHSVSTQEKQCHMSITELNQSNEGIYSKLGRKNNIIESEVLTREKGDLSGNGNKTIINFYECQLCDKVFASKVDLDVHDKLHIGRERCSSKDYEKNSVNKTEGSFSLTHHERRNTSEKPFKCDSCEKSYANEKTLKFHQRAHGEKQYQCPYCEKKFLKKNHMIRHERIHTGEKPFGCKYCQKKFSQKASLTGHEMVHTGNKPFMCRFCEKRFVQKISLTRHERIHTGEKPFHCKYCDKSFVQESNLKFHQWVHTNEKPFRCSFCEKRFVRKYDLVRHEEVHAHKEPFQCTYGEREFPRYSEVMHHEGIHIGERPF